MSDALYRRSFVLSLPPDINGHFQVALRFDSVPVEYVFSGALGPKAFSQTYTTRGDARRAMESTFADITLFLDDVQRQTALDAPERIDGRVFTFSFPNAGGDLLGTFQIKFDVAAPDVAQFFITLDGTSLTVKRTTLDDIYAAIRPLGDVEKHLYAHARLDVQDAF